MSMSCCAFSNSTVSVYLLQFNGNIYVNQTVTFLALLWSVNYFDVEWTVFPKYYEFKEFTKNRMKISFYKSGPYTVSAFSKIEDVFGNKTVVVLPCGPPELTLIGSSNVTMTRSSTLHLAVSVESCHLHPAVHKWEIEDVKISRFYNKKFLNEVILNTSTLHLTPRILPLGKYVLRFTSTYGDTGDLSELLVELTVTSSTPMAIIAGGDEKIISASDEIVLDASNSFNPDKSSLENQGLVYHWSCQKGFISYFEITTESPITILPPNYLKPDREYNIFLWVKSRNSALSSLTAQQTLHIKMFGVLHASIECISCKDSGLYQLSYFHVLRLSGRCHGLLCDGHISYNWTVLRNDSQVLHLDGISTTGGHSQNLVISKFVFHQMFLYVFKLKITKNNNLIGFSSMTLSSLALPDKTFCSSEFPSKLIVAMADILRISCSGQAGKNDSFAAYRAIIIQKFHPYMSYMPYEGPNGNLSFYVAPLSRDVDNLIIKVFIVDKYFSSRAIFEKKFVAMANRQTDDYFLGLLNEHLVITRKNNNFKETLPNIFAFLFLLNTKCKKSLFTSKNDDTQRQTDSRRNILEFLNDYMVLETLVDVQQLAHAIQLLTECYLQFPNNTHSSDMIIRMLGDIVIKSNSLMTLIFDGSEMVPNYLFSACENMWNNILHHFFNQGNISYNLNNYTDMLQELEHISVHIISNILQKRLIGERETFSQFGDVIVHGKRCMSQYMASSRYHPDFVVSFDVDPWHEISAFELMHGFVVFKWNNTNSHGENASVFLFNSFFKNCNGDDVFPQLPFNLTVITPSSKKTLSNVKQLDDKIHIDFQNTSAFHHTVTAGEELTISFELPSSISYSIGVNLRLSLERRVPTPITLHIIWSKMSNMSSIVSENFWEISLTKEYSTFKSITSREIKEMKISSTRILIKNNDNSTEVKLTMVLNSVSCTSGNYSCEVYGVNDTHVTCTCEKCFAVQVVKVPFRTTFLVTILKPSAQKVNLLLLITISGFGILLIIGSVLTHQLDKNSHAKDINLFGHYEENAYLLTVLTGSGTTSNIGFQIRGELTNSDKIHINVPDMFRKHTQETFLVATKKYLGIIKSIKVWHDNSGVHPSWKIFWISIKDLKMDKTYHFNCQYHLSIDKTLCKSFSPLEEPMLMSKIAVQLYCQMRNQHIFFSILQRSSFNPISHLMRFLFAVFSLGLMCCSSAFYYRFCASESNYKYTEFKQIVLRDTLACLSLSLITWCITIVLAEVVRIIISKINGRLNFKTENDNCEEFICKMPHVAEKFLDLKVQNISLQERKHCESHVLIFSGGRIALMSESMEFEWQSFILEASKQRNRMTLITVLAIFPCLLATVIFGKGLSNDVSIRWFYMSIGGEIIILFLYDTIKIFISAVVNATFKNLPQLMFEVHKYQHFIIKQRIQTSKIRPLGGFSLSQAKNRHERRQFLKHSLKTVALQLILTLNVGMFLMSTVNNKERLELRSAMEKHFDFKIGFETPGIQVLKRYENIWAWINSSMMKVFSLPGEGHLILNQPIRIRQIRSTSVDCITNEIQENNKMCLCNPHWLQDKMVYNPGWMISNASDGIEPWIYNENQLSFTLRGRFGHYGEEGYSVLIKNYSQSEELLHRLKKQAWIDVRTKVLLQEFVAYMPSYDIFSSITLALEFSCTGYVYSLKSFELVQLSNIKSQGTIVGLISSVFQIVLSTCLICHCMSKQSSKKTRFYGILKIILCWTSALSFIYIVTRDKQICHDYLKNRESFTSFKKTYFYKEALNITNAIFFWVLISESIEGLQNLSTFSYILKTFTKLLKHLSKAFLLHLSILALVTAISHFLVPPPGQYESFVITFMMNLHQSTTLHANFGHAVQPFLTMLVITFNTLFFAYSVSVALRTFRNLRQENSLLLHEKHLTAQSAVRELKLFFRSRNSKRPTFQRVQFQELSEERDFDDTSWEYNEHDFNISLKCNNEDFDDVSMNYSDENSNYEISDLCRTSEGSESITSSDLLEELTDPFFVISVSLDITQHRLNYLTRHGDDDI